MSVPFELPALLADPDPGVRPVVLRGATLFDGTGSDTRHGMAIVVSGGRVVEIGEDVGVPEGALVVNLGGRFLMPGLIDCHAHLDILNTPSTAHGEEPVRPGVMRHLLAAELQRALRMGITTIRHVGAYGDSIFELRQAMRHGAFRGPRLLISGRLIAATSPQARLFDGMYREADGPEEMRKAVREQIRAGADFVKVMTTGARSVEWENPGPAQITREELRAVVEEAHRLGYRVAAHCEGLDGTRLAIEEGVDTIEHGFYLHQEPELLDQLRARRGVLVPTLSFLRDVAELKADEWSTHLVERGTYNWDQARRTLQAAMAAGVPIAMGYDNTPEDLAASELELMVEAGMSTREALRSATSTAAMALGLERLIGTVAPGMLADLIVVDGDPIEDVGVLTDPSRIHLILQLGEVVAGAAIEVEP